MLSHLGFLRDVWGIQGIVPDSELRGYLAVLSRPGQDFREWPLFVGTQLPFTEQPEGWDLFFTPNLFTGPRVNNMAAGHMYLYADLDDAPYPVIEPTYYWETSKDSWQAMWQLSARPGAQDWATLNRAMTRFLGADSNGWPAAKLLRVPGSVNWKRDGQTAGSAVDTGERYAFTELWEFLGPQIREDRRELTGPHPPLPDPQHKQAIMADMWDYLGLLSRSMLTNPKVSDRSHWIVQVAYQLAGEGVLPPEQVFDLIWVQDWCKWRVDGHKPEQLWLEIQRAFDAKA